LASKGPIRSPAGKLENAPEAFLGMLDGHNFGKAIVRLAAEG
jgi:NADPH-dependent curcumin reductase CurA